MNKQRIKKTRAKSGFTLVELLLVMVILATLAGIGLKNMSKHSGKSKLTQAQANIMMLDSAVTEFEIINGTFPSSLEELLSTEKGGPFLAKKVIPKDPNGFPFTYVNPGSHNTHRIDISCDFDEKTPNNWE